MRSNFAILSVLAFVASVSSAPVGNRLVPKAVPDVYRVAADPTRVDRRAAPAIEIEAIDEGKKVMQVQKVLWQVEMSILYK